jgi:hypothetical protein
MRNENPFENGTVVDSRDVNDYLETLENNLIELREQDDENEDEESEEVGELQEQVNSLRNFIEECQEYNCDWDYGAQLIPIDRFTEYTEELVKDIGDLPSNIPNYIVIDWGETAENLKEDYTEVEYNGEAYYILNT